MRNNKHKAVSLLCAVLFLCMPVFTCTGQASLDNLLTNGDFTERDTSGNPIGWSCSEGDWQTVIRPADEGVILSRETNGNNLSVSQRVTGVVPGAEYEVSARVKSQNVNGSAVSVKIEYWKGDPAAPKTGDFLGDTQGSFLPNTNGTWQTMTQVFAIPAGCERAVIMFRLYGRGTVQYKEASLVKVEDPILLELQTDQVFYYEDAKGDGTGSLTATEFYNLSYDNKTVLFSLTDPNGNLLKSETAVFAQGTGASFAYPLTLLTEEKTAYTVRAEFCDSGEVILTFTQHIYKYPRPAGMDASGQRTDTDGNPFYPVCAYHCREKDLAKAAQAGVNLVQGYWSSLTPIEYLDMAAQYGMKVMVSLYPNLKPAAHPDSMAYTQNLLETLRDHPALFGWMIMDEPYYNLYQPEQLLEDSYIFIREYDAVHPIYILECTNERLADAAKYGDILAVDPYIGSGDLEHTVSDMVQAAKTAVNGQKPVVAILQTSLIKDHFPNADELLHTVCQAVLSGADGIGYYCFENAYGSTSLTDTPLWDGLTQIGQTALPELFASVSAHDYDGLLAESTQGDVWYQIWKRDGRYAGVALNQSQEVQTISVSGCHDVVLSVLGNGTASINAELLELELPMHGVIMFNLGTAAYEFPSVLRNGIHSDFSFGAGGMPESWRLYGDTWEQVLQDGANGQSPDGGRYIALQKGDAAACMTAGLEPLQTYCISVYVRAETDGAAAIHTAFMHDDGTRALRLCAFEKANGIQTEQTFRFANTYGGTDTFCSTDGEWKKIKYTITLPAYANAIKIMLKNTGGDAAVSYSGLRIETARNLLSNGDFEGVDTVYTETAGQLVKVNAQNMALVSTRTYGTPVAAAENGGLPQGSMMRYLPPCEMQAYVPVRCGETYHISFDYANISTSAVPYLWIYCTEGTEQRFFMQELPKNTNVWQHYETIFTVDAPCEKGSMTEIRIEWKELSGRGTVCFDNLEMEIAGVRYYQNFARLYDGVCKAGDVIVETDYIPSGNREVTAVAAAYYSVNGAKELLDVKVWNIPAGTDTPVTVKSTLRLPSLAAEGSYTVKGFFWEW